MVFTAQSPSEFIVEEILPDGTVLQVDKVQDLGKPEDQALERDYFTHFILQKTDWNTMQALGALAVQMHVKPGRFDFAGTKDKNAVTVQRCSAFAMAPSRILPAEIKDIKILGAWKSKDRIKMGHLGGNRFTITLTEANCGKKVTAESLQKRADAMGFRMKNFFGRQRFGSLRGNTAKVGKMLLAGNFEAAAWEYVAGEGPEPENFAQARAKLREEKDFAAATTYFPGPLKYEKMVLWHLAEHPTDFVGALRRLPPNLQLMLVHAYQSQLFNEYIGKSAGDFSCSADALGFPEAEKAVANGAGAPDASGSVRWPCAHIIGYDTALSENEAKFLEAKGLKPEFFKIKSMPNLSVKGTFRATEVPLKDFSAEDNVLQDGMKAAVVRFSLPSGSYATVALDQLLD
ncbi:tRNA pseudouridine(13) synthase TruD [Candidatus Micrarchaeota archaeon]|nr:tRNA pseudouridine(13) synthase TruD [Candidatus Micrarchaeota archaeon]